MEIFSRKKFCSYNKYVSIAVTAFMTAIPWLKNTIGTWHKHDWVYLLTNYKQSSWKLVYFKNSKNPNFAVFCLVILCEKCVTNLQWKDWATTVEIVLFSFISKITTVNKSHRQIALCLASFLSRISCPIKTHSAFWLQHLQEIWSSAALLLYTVSLLNRNLRFHWAI